jgi:hypothetical protein
MLSYFLSLLYPANTDSKKIRMPTVARVTFAGFFASLVGCMALSEYLTFTQSQSTERSKLAYALNARNWYAGINYARALMDQQEYSQARRVLTTELKKRPHNFVALRELAHIEWLSHHKYQACLHLKHYDAYFGNDSSYTPFRISYCSNQQPPHIYRISD